VILGAGPFEQLDNCQRRLPCARVTEYDTKAVALGRGAPQKRFAVTAAETVRDGGALRALTPPWALSQGVTVPLALGAPHAAIFGNCVHPAG
jgi:hypothetical protein